MMMKMKFSMMMMKCIIMNIQLCHDDDDGDKDDNEISRCMCLTKQSPGRWQITEECSHRRNFKCLTSPCLKLAIVPFFPLICVHFLAAWCFTMLRSYFEKDG